jgi:hypothetical protein
MEEHRQSQQELEWIREREAWQAEQTRLAVLRGEKEIIERKEESR